MSDLVIDGLAKSYGRSPVLDGIDLIVKSGETVVICGPSGGGKTVLLRLVSGVLEPDRGDIRIGGRSVIALGPEQRDVGMAFQNFALYPHMTAFENIASPLRARRLAPATVRGRVEEIAELLRIGHVLGHMPRELSNGQKQRTSLARSLICGPGVLLLDDPLRNVDAKLRYEMRLELPRLLGKFGSAVLYVTQDYKEAMALGERVGVLRDGRFEQIAAPAAIYGRPSSVEVARLFGDPTINLYPVRLRRGTNGGATIELFGRILALRGMAGVATERDCLVGLRPEEASVTTQPTPTALPLKLEAVTPLNVRSVLYLRTGGGEEVLVTVSEEEAVQFGRGHRDVWIDVDPDRLLLFDRQSGARIASSGN
jgi:multiple sugar transport system ATP-binding protein